jgi:hypothetical protein
MPLTFADRDAYISKLATWSRADLLRTCRAAGVTAHRVPTEKLPELLWAATAVVRQWNEKRDTRSADAQIKRAPHLPA